MYLSLLILLSLFAPSFGVIASVNLINKGDMEASSGWAINAKTSDLVLTYAENEGVNGSMAMKLSSTEMGSDGFYVVSNNTEFTLNNNDNITVTFWAKASSSSMSIRTYVQEKDNDYDLTDFPILTLSTSLEKYTLQGVVSSVTSTSYKIKFRISSAGDFYIDNVEVKNTDVSDVEVNITPDNENIRYNGTLSSIVTEESAELYRFSDKFFNEGTSPSWYLPFSRTQSGVSISFKTNSPKIQLVFEQLENSEFRSPVFSVFKDGIVFMESVNTLNFEMENTNQDLSEWEIYLPYFSGIKFRGMRLEADYQLYPIEEDDKPLFVSIGNSITHGTGQNSAIETYPYLIANDLGFRLINLGIGGSKINTSILINLENISPKLISVLWGYNDVNSGGESLEQPLLKYETLITQLCKNQPQADIYCIMQPYTTTTTGAVNSDNHIDSLRKYSRVTVEKLQEDYENLYIVEGLDYVTSVSDLSDKVHLNVQGASKLAEGFVQEYQENSSTTLVKNRRENISLSLIYPNPVKEYLFLDKKRTY
ncbi:MAG TPA: SGNH/GDSL hydrolase family protein, partial [Bacteroidales bacterium]|nr:SGNH/GDSL hydrolase family protein [Bacteroidales bacterium]